MPKNKGLSKAVHVRVPPDLEGALSAMEQKYDIDRSWIIRSALRQFLSQVMDRDTGLPFWGEQKVGAVKARKGNHDAEKRDG